MLFRLEIIHCQVLQLRASSALLARLFVGWSARWRRRPTLFEKAWAAGAHMGCVNLGVRYERGEGRPKDPARALELYAKACAAGIGFGCRNQARSLRLGVGTAKDPAQGATVASKGC